MAIDHAGKLYMQPKYITSWDALDCEWTWYPRGVHDLRGRPFPDILARDVTLKFESALAVRIISRKDDKKKLKSVVSFVAIVIIVLTLTSSTMATPQAVIQLGSKNSIAKYMGQFDGKANVVMMGAISVQDWISIKVPFKGHLSDVESITYSAFISQTGGNDSLEPYVVLKMTEGRYLVCYPEDSYSSGLWSLPYYSWQVRDTVSHGKWVIAPAKTESLVMTFADWVSYIGDYEVISVTIHIGGWDISNPYQCYLGDLAINGRSIDIANAGRSNGNSADLPPGF
jgi:hypothetical protein